MNWPRLLCTSVRRVKEMVAFTLAKALDENIVATSSKYLHITATVICNIFDMIKGNESDVGNIGFELQAKRDDKF